jgi:hypothetical protein
MILKRSIRVVKREEKEARKKTVEPVVTQEKREEMQRNDMEDNVSTWVSEFRAGQQAYVGLQGALKALGGD